MPLSLKIFSRKGERKRLVDERMLDGQRITVGRGQTCTVVLEDPSRHLSRIQAEFERTARGYLLRVMSGTSPVVINGVPYFRGSEVAVHAGDTLVMEGYDLEVVSMSVPQASAAAAPAQASAAPEPSPSPERSTAPATARPKWLAMVGTAAAVTIAGAVVLALSWPAIKGLLPESAEGRKSEQTIARLEGEARSLLKLVDSDRREIKDATAATSREIERVEAMVRSTRTSQDRMAFDAALREARRMAQASVSLQDKVRDRVEGPSGLPKAEGILSAAAAAAKGGDRAEAIKLLEGTVASLTQMRSSIAEDRKTTQAELEKRREDLLAAETRAMTESEARAKAETETRARAKSRADAEAALAPEPDQLAQAAQIAASPCLGGLAGEWTHPVGGTWTFAGNRGTRVVAARDSGSKARQIAVMSVSSCENDTMTYKVVRLALVNTDDPGQGYDRTAANAPSLSIWAKVHTQRYAISSAGLRLGAYTYAKR